MDFAVAVATQFLNSQIQVLVEVGSGTPHLNRCPESTWDKTCTWQMRRAFGRLAIMDELGVTFPSHGGSSAFPSPKFGLRLRPKIRSFQDKSLSSENLESAMRGILTL